MPVSTLTTKGQVTIPKEVRDFLKVDAGDRLEFTLEADGSVRLHRPERSHQDLYGVLRRPGANSVSLEEMDLAIVDAVAAEDERVRSNGR